MEPALPGYMGYKGYWGQTPISLQRKALHPVGEPKARRIWTLTPKPRELHEVNDRGGHIHRGGHVILQPAPLSASAFAATPITLFSLFST